jgi:hypothetical protein
MTMANAAKVLIAFAVIGCASTQTRLGTVSTADVAAEQATQGLFALKALLALQARVTDVGYPLLIAAAPLCGADVRRSMGLTVANVRDFSEDAYQAARAVGMDDTLRVIHVATGSGAERIGIHEGDAIIAVDTMYLRTGAEAEASWIRTSALVGRSNARSIRVSYRRGASTVTVDMPLDVSCGYTIVAARAEALNAYSDGRSVYVTSAMLRFVADDDELATVLSHEIAHNVMHHIQAKQKNSLLGALLGAVVDIGAAFGHYNTHGAYSQMGAEAGAMKFSQDFEREADYVGLYVLALGHRPIDKAPNFWRRMASEVPSSITFASSHPTTAERFVRLEQWTAEVQTKLANGAPLRPEMKLASTDHQSGETQQTGAVVETQAAGLLSSSQSSPPRAPVLTSDGRTGIPPVEATTSSVSGDTRRAPPRLYTPDTTFVRPNSRQTVIAPTAPIARSKAVASSMSPPAGASETPLAAEQIGAALSDADARAARKAFEAGDTYFARHEWANAELWLRKAILLDGAQAVFHAELGQVLVVESRWPEAEAAFSAAVLLDVDNAEYRSLLKDARSH